MFIKKRGNFCFWLYQNSWHQTNHPTENNYKSWIPHIQQLLKSTGEQPKQSRLEKLRSQRHWKCVKVKPEFSVTFSPQDICQLPAGKGMNNAVTHKNWSSGLLRNQNLNGQGLWERRATKPNIPCTLFLLGIPKPSMQHKTH